MGSQQLTPEEVKTAQELIARVQGISSCQITTDENGGITEIHVVATVDKPPKLIARDVETCLKAGMGIDVDYKKIGVVIFDSEEALSMKPPSPSPDNLDAIMPENAPHEFEEFVVDEYSARLGVEGVNLFRNSGGIRAEVELVHETTEVMGAAEGSPAANPLRIVAEATLAAVGDFLDESIRLCLGEVLKLQLGEKDAVVVRVDVSVKREGKSLVGCAIITGDPVDAVVCATLDAINRIVGRLDFKSSIEYKIS